MAQESSPPPKSSIDAKEDLVFLTSGAKEKLSKTMVGASEAAYKMIHPFNREARDQATEKAKELKREVSQKQAGIRATAHEQAEADRSGASTPPRDSPLCPNPASDGVPSREQQAEAAPPAPHMGPSPSQPSEVQNVFASRGPVDDSGSSSDGSSRAGIPTTAADYRSA